MQEFAAKDKAVKLLMARERAQAAADDFDGLDDAELPEDYNDEWKAELEYTKSGKLLCNIANIILILENDPALAGHIVHDLFTGMDSAKDGLPWNKNANQLTRPTTSS